MVEIHSIALQVGDGSVPTLKCLTSLLRRTRAISSPAFCTPLRLLGSLASRNAWSLYSPMLCPLRTCSCHKACTTLGLNRNEDSEQLFAPSWKTLNLSSQSAGPF